MNRNSKIMLIFLISVIATACATAPNIATPAPAAITTPVPLPNPNISGYTYPETEATILQHVNDDDQAWIRTHAWGLWTALTTEVVPGVRVYETWQSPDNGQILSPGPLSGNQVLLHHLHVPNQFHGKAFGQAIDSLPSTSNQVMVTVNWSPEMADDVAAHDYLSSTALNKLLTEGTTSITLNNRSISVKPTYLWMGAPLLIENRYYRLSTWPGTPSKPTSFPSNLWGQCIWVDTQDQTSGSTTGVDTTCSADGSSRTPANTYGLGNFIHFKLSNEEAKEFNLQTDGGAVTGSTGNSTPTPTPLQAGDTVILAAMHVGTREMTEWTWQTYWWQPDANNPPAPSSKEIADARPAQLTGAARHYAQCTAYQMVTPNQPITGGSGTNPLICYNPYLEAPFPPLSGSKPWTYEGTTYNLSVGVETNCMSCHIQASYAPGTPATPAPKTLPYTADRYIDLNDPAFTGFLKMDFSWSIVQNVAGPTPTP